MPAAQIQFSQSPTTTPAGQSALGYVTGTQVNFTDAAGPGATSWAWTLVGFPGPISSPPTINNSTTQTANMTPTTDGVYILKVVRTDPGPIVTSDTRFFAIGDADYGLVLPSAGMTGAMTNVGGSVAAQAAGWEGRQDAGTNVFIDAIFRFLRSRVGRFIGLQQAVTFSSSSPSTVTVIDGTDKPWRVLTLTGSALYTEQIANSAPTPAQGKRFKYKISLTAGSGGFALLNGVSGSSILALVAPPAGTTTYDVEVGFDGTNWVITRVTTTDPLQVTKTHIIYGVSGLQSTSQTIATRIGSLRIDPSKFPANAQIRFEVAIETTGPQANVQLFNLTDSVLVAGSLLTTTNTTTTILSATVTLPNSQKDYEVQLFSNSGGVTADHVDCTMAKVILTWG